MNCKFVNHRIAVANCDHRGFLRQKVLDEAIRQTQAANAKGLTVEWLVTDQTAVNQLKKFSTEKNVNVLVKYLSE